MSYRSWTDYGYGIVFDDIPVDDITLEKVKELLDLAPNEKAFIENEYGAEPTLEDYEEYGGGIAYILAAVMREFDDIPFQAICDYNGIWYVVLPPTYPWALWPHERDLLREEVDILIEKYVKMLTDRKIEIDYQEIENGG